MIYILNANSLVSLCPASSTLSRSGSQISQATRRCTKCILWKNMDMKWRSCQNWPTGKSREVWFLFFCQVVAENYSRQAQCTQLSATSPLSPPEWQRFVSWQCLLCFIYFNIFYNAVKFRNVVGETVKKNLQYIYLNCEMGLKIK